MTTKKPDDAPVDEPVVDAPLESKAQLRRDLKYAEERYANTPDAAARRYWAALVRSHKRSLEDG